MMVYDLTPDRPRFVTEWRDITNAVVDTNAVAAWTRKVEELKAAMAKAEDVPPEVWRWQADQAALKPFIEAMEAVERGETVDVVGLRQQLLAFAARHPDEITARSMLSILATAFDHGDPTALATEWEAFAESPNTHGADFTRQKLAFLKRIREPLEIAFTAVDGRSVDLKKLRGKVVLVDFWATWCQSCVAELPRISRMYERYHEQGLEVVGISLEMASFTPDDSPEVKASSLAKAKNRLLRFVANRKLPWPQYFDGKGWENEIAKDYALTCIPTLFILDRTGRLAFLSPRGDALESEIQRLLKTEVK